jgi:uncharacterized membrane-anchored protein YhcB (DUF1043 family)
MTPHQHSFYAHYANGAQNLASTEPKADKHFTQMLPNIHIQKNINDKEKPTVLDMQNST